MVSEIREAQRSLLVGAVVLVAATVSLFGTTTNEVPMYDEGVMVLVPAKIVEVDHYLLVDTGSETTVLSEALRPSLGKPIGKTIAETPYQPHLAADLYAAPEIVLGNVPMNLKQVLSLNLEMAQLISGKPCAGVLGIDSLSDYAITFDFERGFFSLDRNSGFKIPPGGSVFPLLPMKGGRFGVTATLNGKHSLTLMIDSGSSVSVSLNSRDWDELFGPSANTVGKTSYFAGAGGAIRESRIARLDSLHLGPLRYNDLLVEKLPNPESVSHVGLAFLRQNLAILDFPHKQLFLAKTSIFRPEEDDMSGLHLLRISGSLVVFAVDVGSPAEIAGLHRGDQITLINGVPSSQMQMVQIRYIFEQKDKTPIEIEGDRDQHYFSTKIVLKQML